MKFKLKVGAIHSNPVFPIQHLHIIVGSTFVISSTTVWHIKIIPTQGHGLDVCLPRIITVSLCRPVVAAYFIGGPLVTNVSSILCSNHDISACGGIIASIRYRVRVLFFGTGQLGTSPSSFVASTPPRMCMLFLITNQCANAVASMEGNGVHIPVIVDIDNGAAVAFDDLLLQLLILFFTEMEAIPSIIVSTCFCLLTGGAALLLRLSQRILVIIGILFPVEYLVLDRLPLPLGSQRHALRQSAAKFKLLVILIEPLQEIIAHTGGSGRLCRDGIRGHKDRGDVAAASGIKGNPGSLRHYSLQGDVGFADRNLGDIIALSINLPAHDTLIQARGEGHIGGGDGVSIFRFHSVDNLSLIIQEEDVVHLLKLGVITVSCAGGSLHRLLHKFLSRGFIIPAGELAVLLLRGLRSKDSVTGHDILGVFQFPIHIELICINIVFVRFYHIHRRYHAVAGLTILCPGIQRQHGEHHDKCQECGEYPFC